jgi:hypothetical protein
MVSADAVPALDAIDPEVCYLGWDVVLTTDRPRQATDTVFLRDDMELSIEPVGDPGRGGRDHDRVGRCASRFAPQTDRSLEHPAQSNANYNYSNNIKSPCFILDGAPNFRARSARDRSIIAKP